MTTPKYTREQFEEAVRVSYSIASVLKKIGLIPNGGNYNTAHKKIKIFNLDTSHFTGMGHLRGKKHEWAKKTPLSDILVECYYGGVNSNNLKKKLFEVGVLQKKCYRCGINEWMGKPLSLELEHKNGNRYDNRIENLEILCPNCHSLTTTYRGRGNKNKKEPVIWQKIKRKLIDIDICDNELLDLVSKKSIIDIGKMFDISPKTVTRICVMRNINIPNKSHLMKKFEISKEELKKLMDTISIVQIGKMFGVSDNAIRKRAKKLGILPI